MTESSPAPVLDYGPPERRVARLWRHTPKPSPRTVLLALFAALALWWLRVDHEPWVAVHAFPAGASATGGHVSPDGRRLIVGNEAGAFGMLGPFHVHDVRSGRRELSFGAPFEFARHARFSPDGARIVTVGGLVEETRLPGGGWRRTYGSTTSLVRLWDAATGRLVANLGAVGQVSSGTPYPMQVHFAPDGKRLVTLDTEQATLYDATSGAAVAVLEQRGPPDGFAFIGDRAFFSPDGSKVAVSTLDYGPVRVRSAADGHVVAEYQPERGTPGGYNGGFTADGRTFAFAADGRAYGFDAATGRELFPPVVVEGNAARVAPDGRRLLVTRDAQRADALTALDLSSGMPAATTRPLDPPGRSAVTWSPSGRHLLLLGDSGLEILDGVTLRRRRLIAEVSAPFAGITFSQDGSRAIILANTGVPAPRVELLSAVTWIPTSTIAQPLGLTHGRFTDAIFAGDARHVLTSTDQGYVQLWRRRRPEPAWGVVALPQTWVAGALSLGVLLSVWRDVARFYAAPRNGKDE